MKIVDLNGRRIHCEWWLESRRQCLRPATVEIADPNGTPAWAPRRYCTQHARLYTLAAGNLLMPPLPTDR